MKEKHFFDCPSRTVFWFIAVVSVLWTLQCSVFQTVLGKDIVETVMWGSLWQLGHLKHPPLSGWIGYLTALLSGYSPWAMYLAAQVFLAIGAFYVYKLAREFLNETESAASTLLLYVLFYYNPSSMKFCSHFLEAAFMPAMAFYIVRGARQNRIRDWLAAGFFTALAILGKYSAIIILPGCLIYILSSRETRKCLLKPGIWLGMALGLVLLLPHLVWLVQHDFSCLRHVEKRISDDVMPWYYFLEVALVGILPVGVEFLALLLSWLPARKDGCRKPVPREALFLSLLLTLIPAAVLTLIALCGKDVVLMWYSFLASWTGLAAVALFPFSISRSHFRNLWLLAAAYTLCALIATTIDITVKSRLRCHADTAGIIRNVEAYVRKDNPGRKIRTVIGDRWLAGVIQFYSPDHPKACSDSDSYSIALLMPEIRRNGVLLAGNPELIRKYLPDIAGKVRFDYFTVEHKALFGKRKTAEYWIAFYPGDSGQKNK